jgi:hypothetical protein
LKYSPSSLIDVLRLFTVEMNFGHSSGSGLIDVLGDYCEEPQSALIDFKERDCGIYMMSSSNSNGLLMQHYQRSVTEYPKRQARRKLIRSPLLSLDRALETPIITSEP